MTQNQQHFTVKAAGKQKMSIHKTFGQKAKYTLKMAATFMADVKGKRIQSQGIMFYSAQNYDLVDITGKRKRMSVS